MINDSTDIVTRKIVYSYLNTLYSRMNQYDNAIKYAEIAAPYIKEVDGTDIYASHLIHWALDCNDMGYTDKSKSLFKELEEFLPLLSDNSKIYYFSQYGFLELKWENYTNAVNMLTEGINLCLKIHGDKHVWLTSMYHNLWRAYMLQQDYKNALFYLYKSKDVQIQLNGKAMQRTLDYIKECESK